MENKKEKLKLYLYNFLLYADKNTDILTLYYNKSFTVVASVLNYTDVNNFLENYLDQFDDNLQLVFISGKKKNVFSFIKIIDYNMVTENGFVIN